ncbi:MAG: UDP-N-acetylmuramate--L-alanine ligase [Rikenellaceae bacterium]
MNKEVKESKKNIYFVGIGGIGMSALARYFLHDGRRVAGYDRTASDLTHNLEAEGATVHYEDSIEMIGEEFRDPERTIVIYTPAIPADHTELQYFMGGGFEVVKRSQMLGVLTENKYVMAVAGTHGKSSTSTMLSWLNHEGEGQGCAVLGAISKNFGSNLVLGEGSRVVVEADEFDRSFLRLRPDVAVITSADADHLDIYGTHEAVREAFAQFVELIKEGGSLILKEGVEIELRNPSIEVWRYSYAAECDFYVSRKELIGGGLYRFDIRTPDGVIEGCELGVPGWVNLENCVAAVASMWCAARREGRSLDHDAMRRAMSSFVGLKRRLEIYHSTAESLYIDDYAHHPREIEATLSSIREMLPERHVTAIFQPHLFTRTRDLYEGFADALSLADRVVLLPIYPAREEAIEGVTSEIIATRVRASESVKVIDREQIAEYLKGTKTDVVVSFGAGNIELHCDEIDAALRSKIEN